MQWHQGQYRPQLVGTCTECEACLQVCPFLNSPPGPLPNEANPLGQFVATYVGYSTVEPERATAASGGLTTRLLRSMLESNLVQAVLVIRPTGDPGQLFKATWVRSSKAVLAAAGTKYYPTTIADALRELRTGSLQHYAVVALPCTIRALRLASQQYPWLQERLSFLLGLTCGHMVSAAYTEVLIGASGCRLDAVTGVSYRGKIGTQRSSDYRFQAYEVDKQGRPLPFTSNLVSGLWSGRYLCLNGCLYCQDLFADVSDVTLMDAWLPQYIDDPRGTNLVVVRSPEINHLLKREARAGRIALEPIEPEQVIASQQGALSQRLYENSVRIARARTRGIPVINHYQISSVPVRARIAGHCADFNMYLARVLVRGRGLRRQIGIGLLRLWAATGRLGRRIVSRSLRAARRVLVLGKR